MGEPIPAEELVSPRCCPGRGDSPVSASWPHLLPAEAGCFASIKLVAALARHRLLDRRPLFRGHGSLRAGALRFGEGRRRRAPPRPGSVGHSTSQTSVPSSGYRPLLQGGVRIFEWNGSMMHAKTAVADGLWARVGSTNLNVASWFGNYEMDVIVEDADFARSMEQAFLRDLGNATELVLEPEAAPPRRATPAAGRRLPDPAAEAPVRAAAGAVRIGNAVGAAMRDRRVLRADGGASAQGGGRPLVDHGAALRILPRLAAYPLALLLAWVAFACFHKSYRPRARPRTSSSTGADELRFPPRAEA